MSVAPTTRISATVQELHAQTTSFLKFLSPPVLLGLFLLCLILLRLPTTLLPHELDPDESQALAGAMKFLVDPRPWIAVDGASWGPISPYLISISLPMGQNHGFILLHVLATVLVCLQVVLAYLTIRRFGTTSAAILARC